MFKRSILLALLFCFVLSSVALANATAASATNLDNTVSSAPENVNVPEGEQVKKPVKILYFPLYSPKPTDKPEKYKHVIKKEQTNEYYDLVWQELKAANNSTREFIYKPELANEIMATPPAEFLDPAKTAELGRKAGADVVAVFLSHDGKYARDEKGKRIGLWAKDEIMFVNVATGKIITRETTPIKCGTEYFKDWRKRQKEAWIPQVISYIDKLLDFKNLPF